MDSSSAADTAQDDKWNGFSSPPPPVTGTPVDVDKLLHSDHHSQNASLVTSAPHTYEERDQMEWSSGLCECLSDRKNCESRLSLSIAFGSLAAPDLGKNVF